MPNYDFVGNVKERVSGEFCRYTGLHACDACGALVTADLFDKHTEWHRYITQRA